LLPKPQNPILEMKKLVYICLMIFTKLGKKKQQIIVVQYSSYHIAYHKLEIKVVCKFVSSVTRLNTEQSFTRSKNHFYNLIETISSTVGIVNDPTSKEGVVVNVHELDAIQPRV